MSDRELQAVATRLAEAADYTAIFPAADTVRAVYLRLSRLVHPDRYHGSANGDLETAREAFKRLGELHAEARKALADGHFGQPPVIIRTKRGVHAVKRKLSSGDDIAERWRTETTTENGSVAGLLKVAKSARDNDLMAAEAKALKALHAVDNRLTRHFPQLLDSFVYQDGRRRANVLEWQDGCYNLTELRRAFPDGVDPRHAVWIWRRLLVGLAFTHDQALVHGAVLPPNILIGPSQHAVFICNWCYSVPMPVYVSESKTSIKAVTSDYRDWYPEEVTAKKPPSGATDLVMAARCMIYLLDGDPVTGVLPDRVPRPMRAFFKGCLLSKQSMRPDDAWALLAEFDELLEGMGGPYFPRRFIELVVP